MGVTVTPEAPRGRKPVGHPVDELYREHGAEVYRYAYRVLGNRADAEDMTQSTFLNALRAIERGERPRKPGNWLITIAHNLARERFRRARARPTEVALDVATAAAGPPPDESALSVAELTRALGQIPPAQRSALVMREFEGRPYAEIARSLEITTSALETLLFRARRSLAEELENVVTCERAEQDLARVQAGTLGRKDRRRLDEHLRECPSCTHLQVLRPRPKRALRGLAWLPVPFPLNLFRGGQRVLTTVTAHGTEAATGTTAATTGASLALSGGLAAKVAVVALSTTVVGAAGYAGVHDIRAHRMPQQPPARAASTETGRTGARSRVALARPASPSRGVTHRSAQSVARPAHATPRGRFGTRAATNQTASSTRRVTREAVRVVKTAGKSTTAPHEHQAKTRLSAARPVTAATSSGRSTGSASRTSGGENGRRGAKK